MDEIHPDPERRQFLTGAAAVVGGVGAALAGLPFAASWFPSEKAKALGAPVEVDISKIAPGQQITVPWRGQPIFVVHRTQESLQALAKSEPLLRDPDSREADQPDTIRTKDRAINPQFLVVTGLCTHLGCVPLYKPKMGSLEPEWLGGFFCPCHGSKYDMSGRVYKGVPAPTNLPIPPHEYISSTLLLIGEKV